MSASAERLLQIVQQFEGKKILVIGDLMVDRYLYCEGRKLSREAPVPVSDYLSETMVPGGAANLANNIVSLGGSAYVLGVVGKDAPGEWLQRELKQKGVETGGVLVNERPTTLKTRIVLNNRQYLRIDTESRREVEPHLTDQLVETAQNIVSDVDAVVFADYDKGVVTSELISNLVEASRLHSKKVVAQPKVRHYLDYVGVSFLKSNVREAAIATGMTLVNDTSLRNMGFNLMTRLETDAILLTRGAEGLILFEKKSITSFPPLSGPKTNFNAVGIRDSMNAAVTLSLSAGASNAESTFLSNVAAGVKGDRLGTTVVSVEDLQSQLALNRGLFQQAVQIPVR